MIRFYLWSPTSNLSEVAREQIASQFPGVQIKKLSDYWEEGKAWASCKLGARRWEEATLATVKDSEADPLAGLLAASSLPCFLLFHIKRRDDVIFVRFADTNYPVGLNFLAAQPALSSW